MRYQLLQGDCIDVMRTLPASSVHCVVTSPPYFGLRNYGHDGQIGLEEAPEQYVAKLVDVFREVRRVLRDDGTVWLNLGDSYANGGAIDPYRKTTSGKLMPPQGRAPITAGLKPKDLIGIPWRVAFALQADGWWLRQDIIWHKPNPMPESVTDRCTKAHEYVFLLTKQARYWYDAEAVKEESAGVTGGGFSKATAEAQLNHGAMRLERPADNGTRNRRSVWTIATQPFSGTKLMTDYVGDDGKPYTASPDCPLHGHLVRSRKSYTRGYDEQPAEPLTHNPGTGNSLALESASELKSKTYRNYSEAKPDNSFLQNPESTGENKTLTHQSEHTLADKSQLGNLHTSAIGEPQDCKKDLDSRHCYQTASDRNTQKSKTALALPTFLHDTFSAQIPSGTPNTAQPDAEFGQGRGIGESNIFADDLNDSQDSQNPDGSADNLGEPEFFLAYEELYCICKKVSIDHFATFPPKLVEPMILAGCPAQTCPTCGAGWKRVIEQGEFVPMRWKPGIDKTMRAQDDAQHNGNNDRSTSAMTRGGVNQKITVGFRPSCDCGNPDSVPGVVLDPFNGSGTTGEVGMRNGRNYIGVELNPEYIELARIRLDAAETSARNTAGEFVRTAKEKAAGQLALFAE